MRTDSAVHATAHAVVLDIEGTTGSLSHVRDVLFPYARQRIAPWLAARRGTAQWHQVLAAVRTRTSAPELGELDAVEQLESWADADAKAVPLKTLQGLIWADGYAAGELSGHVYPDVPTALARWKASGVARYIYSSGSEPAQRAWFAHTPYGDLSDLLNGYFDLVSAGHKWEAASYRALAAAIGVPGPQLLFTSDVGEELGAASAAGWQTVAVRRPDDRRGPEVTGHRTIGSLDALELRPPRA
ncbi:acireductone synthase [Streptomyces sp. H27-D2]|uniref:acireductone synthase n=1 Tax=Streptomyces sp. H27-D2 TaxID=3046304 RepID=UPI002DBF5534|nr:acireductone synthase [Streptomyces sp. H27-D2]MEC4015441.1 acireductone synthase [Streptomyces sp. H27-D2]